MRNAARFMFVLVIVFMSAITVAKDRNWQQSTETRTKLWVRDKNEGAPYDMVFRVIQPDGSTVIAKASSGQGGVSEVSFPDSFGLYGPIAHGTYRWEAAVNGKVVATDNFER